jgi:hypothetical protein
MISRPYQSLRETINGRSKMITAKLLATQPARTNIAKGLARRWRWTVVAPVQCSVWLCSSFA